MYLAYHPLPPARKVQKKLFIKKFTFSPCGHIGSTLVWNSEPGAINYTICMQVEGFRISITMHSVYLPLLCKNRLRLKYIFTIRPYWINISLKFHLFCIFYPAHEAQGWLNNTFIILIPLILKVFQIKNGSNCPCCFQKEEKIVKCLTDDVQRTSYAGGWRPITIDHLRDSCD